MATHDDNRFVAQELGSVFHDYTWGLREIGYSKFHKPNPTQALIRVLTLEEKTLTIMISSDGYKVVGDENTVDVNRQEPWSITYETFQSLMMAVSPAFAKAFSDQLELKLRGTLQAASNSGDGYSDENVDGGDGVQEEVVG